MGAQRGEPPQSLSAAPTAPRGVASPALRCSRNHHWRLPCEAYGVRAPTAYPPQWGVVDPRVANRHKVRRSCDRPRDYDDERGGVFPHSEDCVPLAQQPGEPHEVLRERLLPRTRCGAVPLLPVPSAPLYKRELPPGTAHG